MSFLVLKFDLRLSVTALVCLLLLATPPLINAVNESSAPSTKAQKIHAQIIAETPLYDDPKVTEYVSRVGQKVVENSQLTDHKYQFFVLDQGGINAFTPGWGYIYLNRGLLSYMTSEGELAAVLAHEVAHNTERHLARRKSKQIWNNIVAGAATILTGSGSVGSSIALSNSAGLQSFGRELELEADARGAEYMYRANYDPQEMLGLLGILKDDERFRDTRAIQGGGNATYHGVFSSHPRSDKRLQKIISQAGTLPPGESFRGREELRAVLDGMVFGTNFNGNKVPGYKRFTNKALGVTFLYPEDWVQTTKGAKIILKDAAQTVQLKLEVAKTADKTLTSKKRLTTKYPEDLSDVKPINKDPAKDLGTTARRPQQRVAVVSVGRNTFHFQGIAKNNVLTDEQDKQFQQIIASFRRATKRDLPPDSIKTIYYKRLEPGETFADLAASRELGVLTEEYLRLINGYYPKGQPEPGTWIKLVRSGPVPTDKK